LSPDSPVDFCLHTTATTESFTLSLHDALPISVLSKLDASSVLTPELRDRWMGEGYFLRALCYFYLVNVFGEVPLLETPDFRISRSEEHTSELQSRENLVCRLLLEKKKKD